MTTKTYRGSEPIIFGDAHEIADLVTTGNRYLEYAVWTDQAGKFALCRVWPCPSWIEITRNQLFNAA